MLENSLTLQSEILNRYGQLKEVGAFPKFSTLIKEMWLPKPEVN